MSCRPQLTQRGAGTGLVRRRCRHATQPSAMLTHPPSYSRSAGSAKLAGRYVHDCASFPAESTQDFLIFWIQGPVPENLDPTEKWWHFLCFKDSASVKGAIWAIWGKHIHIKGAFLVTRSGVILLTTQTIHNIHKKHGKSLKIAHMCIV